MDKLRAPKLLSCIAILCVMLFSNIERSEEVDLTIIESAVSKGAVCLDGTPPAYQLDRGFGDGVNNWLVHVQGGGWCHSVENCVYRKTMEYGLGSSKLMPVLNFTGILSNRQELNPQFYNWNRVFMRYCDGSSFTGDVEEVDPGTNLHFRGARVFNAIVEELTRVGMHDAQNAILSGCSAGGLASILNCDKFHGFFKSGTKVKCVSDAGYFAHVKDYSGEYHFEKYYNNIVTLHGSTKVFHPDVHQCFYPQFAAPYIKTPIFILHSAYDTWQVSNVFASNESDPSGSFTKCKTTLNECSTSELRRFEDYRSEFLEAVYVIGKKSSNAMFINTCYTHCQSEDQSLWLDNPNSKLYDKTIAEAVGDWFYNNDNCRMIDNEHVLPHYC